MFILIKAKPIVRWGRKATGLPEDSRVAQISEKRAGLPGMGGPAFLLLELTIFEYHVDRILMFILNKAKPIVRWGRKAMDLARDSQVARESRVA
jgi:hypothetical protein